MPAALDFEKILANDTPQVLTPPGDEGNPPPGETGALTEETGETVAPPGEEAPAPEEPKGIPVERFKSETAKRREAERENRELREYIAKNTAPAPTGELKPEDFPTVDAFKDAVKERAIIEARAEVAREADNQAFERFKERVAKEGKEIPGFDDTFDGVFTDNNYMPVHEATTVYLRGAADHPAQLLKWLDDNRAEAGRIFNLEPAAQIKELVRRDALLGRKAAPPVSRAPAPTPSVSGSGSAPQSIEKMSHAQLLDWTREQKRK